MSAISSIAISSAIMPGASPGARMALPSGKSSTARRMAVMRFGPAYSSRVCITAVSGCPPFKSPDHDSWPMAVILPSRVAPMRRRWMVAGRCVVLLIIRGRARATLTGRRAARAPSAASKASARTNSLPPKPPPIYGETIRTLSFGIPKVRARSLRPQSTIWFAVHTVTLSPSQAAIEACGSIIACDWSGVVYMASRRTGAWP
ncbi:hypothetical protein D3C72_1262470 [compost metagenome]